jgi:hypothetical protein
VAVAPVAEGVSPKLRLTTTLLAFFVGGLGVHRFYAGRLKGALTMLLLNILLGIPLTIAGYQMAFAGAAIAGGMGLALGVGGWVLLSIGGITSTVIGIVAFVDFIKAAIGKFKDKQGRLIVNWTSK